MEEVLIVNKPFGITSYDVIRKIKKDFPGEKIGHAGTLDPLAEGLLIVLLGKQTNKRQSEFMGVEKEYEFEVLFGFNTDTYDILGLVDKIDKYNIKEVKESVISNLDNFKGILKQQVPPFSAVKIQGKPLYRWYLNGEIDQVEIPIKEIEVKELIHISDENYESNELKTNINNLLDTVNYGFRNELIKNKWDEIFFDPINDNYLVMKLSATVSKGTYIRALAKDIGDSIGVPACTITINRTRIGDIKLEDANYKL